MCSAVHLNCLFHCQTDESILYTPYLLCLSHQQHTHTQRVDMTHTHTQKHTHTHTHTLTCMSSCSEKKGSTVADSFAPCLCTTHLNSPPNTSLITLSLNNVCRHHMTSHDGYHGNRVSSDSLGRDGVSPRGQRSLLWLSDLHTPVETVECVFSCSTTEGAIEL